jgi:hypothetical protein
MRFFCLGTLTLMLTFGRFAQADTIVIDFDGLSDGTPVTTQYPGVSFSNATVATAEISLDEFEFPPHSGTNVVFDNGGPMTIDFTIPVLSFGGYFTYSEPLTLSALDGSSSPLPSVFSAFSNNEAISGVPGSVPNEFLQVSSGSGISSVTITGDPAGSSFVLDDVTITTPSTPSVNIPSDVAPEPRGAALAGIAVLAMALYLRFGRRSRYIGRS